MSKQDSHFFNNFGLVLGILFAVTILLFAFARMVGANTQAKQVVAEASYVAAVEERVKPFARVAVAGQDNTALAIVENAGGAGAVALAVPEDGAAAYEIACKTCHGVGLAGAPKSGDKANWGPRIAQGKATLYKHAIEGYNGKAGVMPAKGGRSDWPDDLIKLSVDYMVGLNQ